MKSPIVVLFCLVLLCVIDAENVKKMQQAINWLIPIGASGNGWSAGQKSTYVYNQYKILINNGKKMDEDDIIYVCCDQANGQYRSDKLKQLINKLDILQKYHLSEVCKYIGQIEDNKWQRIIIWLISIGQTFLTNEERKNWNDQQKLKLITRSYTIQFNEGNRMKQSDIKYVCEKAQSDSSNLIEFQSNSDFIHFQFNIVKQLINNYNVEQHGYLLEACKFTGQLINRN